MDSLILVEVNKTNINSVLPLRHALWPHMSLDEHRKELTRFFELEDFVIYSVLNGDDEAVAFAEAMIKPHANGCDFSPVLYLEGIWVNDEYRGKKLAKKLVSKLEAFAQEHSIPGLASDSIIGNEDSHLAHLAWGFEETERVICYGKKL